MLTLNIRVAASIIFLTIYADSSYGQINITNTNRILVSDNDTILYVFEPTGRKGFVYPISIRKVATRPERVFMMNNNTSGWPGKHIYKTNRDSIILESNKEQSFLFRGTNRRDTVDVYANFVNEKPNYSNEYIRKNKDKVTYEIPKGFELVNIIIALSNIGQTDDNLVLKNTKYYNDVLSHFKNYKNHPIVTFLNTRFSEHNRHAIYFDARNWAFRYNVEGNVIMPDKVYPEQWGQNFWTGQKNLLQDFAIKSDFESFYNAHKDYYDHLILLEKKYAPVEKMWRWLEDEFPIKYQSYKVIFSPLINGAHNTDRYSANGFSEVINFVSSTEKIKETQPGLMEGLMCGIVFTEIDHNYVNPVSDLHKEDINEIFSDRSKWTDTNGDASNYGDPLAVFNEYMTHALYCLYASFNYSPDDFKIINAAREDLMVIHRKFIRFKAFNEKLSELYLSRKDGEKVADLYPKILSWAKASD